MMSVDAYPDFDCKGHLSCGRTCGAARHSPADLKLHQITACKQVTAGDIIPVMPKLLNASKRSQHHNVASSCTEQELAMLLKGPMQLDMKLQVFSCSKHGQLDSSPATSATHGMHDCCDARKQRQYLNNIEALDDLLHGR